MSAITSVYDVDARRIQCDEIWSFCYAKALNVARQPPLTVRGTIGLGLARQ